MPNPKADWETVRDAVTQCIKFAEDLNGGNVTKASSLMRKYRDALPCPGCGSIKTMEELRAEGYRHGCCPDRPGAPTLVDFGNLSNQPPA
jgi:hypothetical protein